MTAATKKQAENEIVTRMMELAEKGLNCSQIITALTLEQDGKESPDLIRSVTGLGDGCGFFNETCGIFTGAVCLLSWYAGNDTQDPQKPNKLLPMLEDLNIWFREQIDGRYESTRCKDIVGDRVGTPEGRQICGGLLFNAFKKTNELLASYGHLSDSKGRNFV